MTWAALLLLGPALPLVLALSAVAPGARRLLPGALPVAPLPALAAALFAPSAVAAPLPDVLLGASLTIDEVRRVFLGATAFLWSLAGLYARGDMGRARTGWFCGFWLVTLAGNLGVFLAADAVSFYVAFSLLSLAAFGLVVHAGDAEARRAARIYLILAVFGETALLAGLLVGTAAAQSVMITDIRWALARAPLGDLGLLLLVAGLGLKAGLMPLHVWLPLAHPAAPTPASAVLSGAIVKAGVFGLLLFLPLETAAPAWSGGLVAVGLATAYLGILFGLAQTRPKTTLAYSTLSQMGLIVVVLASALASPGADGVAAAAALYAAHHALAKGALFLAVGLVPLARGWRRGLVLGLTGFAALAIAGLPFTGGALAKLAVKGPLGDTAAALLVAASAVGTTLLMLRFMVLLAGKREPRAASAAPLSMSLSFGAAVVAALAVPWMLFPELTDHAWTYALAPANLWAGAWPLLAGAVAWILARRFGAPSLSVPEGDLVVLAERAAAATAMAWAVLAARAPRPRVRLPVEALGRGLSGAEILLRRWPAASGALLSAILAAFGLLAN